MPMNNRLLRPQSSVPKFSAQGYTRLWGLTAKSTGNVSGVAETDAGYFAVKWWDNSVGVYDSGNTFSKAAAGGRRAFEVYPLAEQGTALLLNFNGTNGSTTFTDSSGNGLTVTASGDAEISTAQSNFGGASLFLDGGNVEVPGNSSIDLSFGDWTIEFWCRPASQTASYPSALGRSGAWEPGAWSIRYDDDSHPNTFAVVSNDLSMYYLIAGQSFAADQWHHVAVVRSGLTDSLYVNGVLEDSCTHGSAPSWPDFVGQALLVGGSWDGAEGKFYGYIDDLRITKGALYTATFTPPSSQLTSTPLAYVASGQFDGFDLSSNSLTALRAEGVSLATLAGGTQYVSGYGYTYVPGEAEQGNLSDNLLSSQALNTFYADLLGGSGDLLVTGNPGIDADDPTIATAKGYTVFGSEPP
jgi:hypothetical protein